MVRAAAIVAWAAAILLTGVVATAATSGQTGSQRLLDVPYLPQSEDLCGGAAVAMVLRYWGDQQVQAEDFAPLVDRTAAGIRTDVLTAAVGQRGWNPYPQSTGASGEWIRDQIDQGRPVIALIQVAPNRYHYIVIVGWTAGRVIAHDPANAPFTVMAMANFEHAWAAAGRWALLVLPGDTRGASRPPSMESRTSTVTGACGPLIQNMVDLARAGDLGAAETGLITATQLCPAAPAAWREIAGIRFLQSRWAEAASFARRATELEPGDQAGWDLLATSRFLNDEPGPALRAWNQMARPTVDLVRVQGVRRTRHPVVARLMDLQPDLVLTPARLGRAARRLDELPSAAVTRLQFRPLAGGRAEIEAAVVERPALPRGVMPIASAAARAGLQGEMRIETAAPTRSGELLTTTWRWSAGRPRLAVSLAVPAVSWLPGITTVEGSWERQTYLAPSTVRTERRHAGLRVADWASGTLRWSAGVGFDRWADDRHVSTDAAVDLRLLDDRVSLAAAVGAWMPAGSGRRFTTGGSSAAWRSTADRAKPVWSATAGAATASANAPLDLWPGAGTGHSREALLRAHPLLEGGVVTGETFGRQLVHGSLEYRHPLPLLLPGTLQLAVFGDTARAWHRPGSDGRAATHADVGAGLRVVLPGRGGTLRVDLARGMRDKRMAVSAGWLAPWPGRIR